MFFRELIAAFFNISISVLYCKARGTRGHILLSHALQAGMSWVRWGHWNFSLTVSFQLQYGPGIDSDSDWNEYQEISLEGGVKVRRADNTTTFMCRLSWNLEASASWNPQGLCRPVMGLVYLLLSPSWFHLQYLHMYADNVLYWLLYVPLLRK